MYLIFSGIVLTVVGFAFMVVALISGESKSKVLYKFQGQGALDGPVLRYRFNGDGSFAPRPGDANYDEGHVYGLARGHAVGQMIKILWDGSRWIRVNEKGEGCSD